MYADAGYDTVKVLPLIDFVTYKIVTFGCAWLFIFKKTKETDIFSLIMQIINYWIRPLCEILVIRH